MTPDGGVLATRDLRVRYGAIEAVRGVDLDVAKGEIVALLGANGAGKSSILNALMGLVPAASGRVTFDREDIAGHPPESIVRRGMTLCPEGRQVFGALTVAENLTLGSAARRDRSAAKDTREQMLDLFPVLATRLAQNAGTLSGGEQQMLSIARAMMSAPKLLLLDEPSLGLAPKFVDTIFELIEQLQGRGVTILLVEQNVDLALDIASRGYVLSSGKMFLEGKAETLRRSETVEQVYLGVH